MKRLLKRLIKETEQQVLTATESNKKARTDLASLIQAHDQRIKSNR